MLNPLWVRCYFPFFHRWRSENKLPTWERMRIQTHFFCVYFLPHRQGGGLLTASASKHVPGGCECPLYCALLSRLRIYPSVLKLSTSLYISTCSPSCIYCESEETMQMNVSFGIVWVIFSSQIGTSIVESHSLRGALPILRKTVFLVVLFRF